MTFLQQRVGEKMFNTTDVQNELQRLFGKTFGQASERGLSLPLGWFIRFCCILPLWLSTHSELCIVHDQMKRDTCVESIHKARDLKIETG